MCLPLIAPCRGSTFIPPKFRRGAGKEISTTGSRGWGVTGSHERIETVVTVEKLMQSDAKDIDDLDRDILEQSVPEEVLAVLLKDRSTGRNRECGKEAL